MLYFSLLQILPSPTQDWLFISTESGGYAFIRVADNRIPGPTFVNLVYYLKDDIKVNFVRYRCSVMFNRFAAPRQDGKGWEGWIFQCQVPRQRWQIRDWLVISARWVVASLLFQWKTTCIWFSVLSFPTCYLHLVLSLYYMFVIFKYIDNITDNIIVLITVTVRGHDEDGGWCCTW